MQKSDVIYKKIESFLIANGCEPWGKFKNNFIAPNGHRFSFETTSGIISIFHRDSEWGRKSNFFEWIREDSTLEKTFSFIERKLKEDSCNLKQ